MSIVKLDKHEIINALPLFGEIPLGWDVMLDAAQDFGFLLADDRVKPNVAMAFIGGCVLYGGDAGHSNARTLVAAMEIQPLILPYPVEWTQLLKEVYGGKVQSEERFFLPYASLDPKAPCKPLAPEFELRKIDLSLASRLQAEIGEEYHLHHYHSLEDFVDRGCGFCICKGQEVCAAAIASLRGKNAIQIQINTKDKYRRQGLASHVGAALLGYCREQELRADWDAGNPASRDLAQKLGYNHCTTYRCLSLLPK